MASMRKCICCNDSYKYCPNCSSDKKKPSYMAVFCSESCKDLWDTLSRYSMDMISKSEAVEKIQSLELKDKYEYVACVQRDLENVVEEEKKSRKFTKKVEPAVKVEQIVEQLNVAEQMVIEPVHEVILKEEE